MVSSDHLPLTASLPEIIPSTAELAEGRVTTFQLQIREEELIGTPMVLSAACPARLPNRDSLALCEIGLKEQAVI